MNNIDIKTKKLISKKNWQSPKSLYDMGYIFFGPVVFNFFIWLKEESNGCDKILFNSREGYFFKIIANMFKKELDLPEYVYFKTSRRLSFMASFFNKEDIYHSFKLHKYKGSFKEMMYNRFGILTEEDYEINTINELPNIDSYVDNILNKSIIIRNEYKLYIDNIIGNSKDVIMVDNGYQGTTQYNIQKAYGLKLKGRYLTYKGNSNLEDVKGFFDFNNSNLKDNFIFFESVFTDRVGTFIDIIDGKFINEDTDGTYFSKNEDIIRGVIYFFKDMFYGESNLENPSYKFSDYLFNIMCSKNFIINDELFEHFFHDNTYTRNFTKKIERR